MKTTDEQSNQRPDEAVDERLTDMAKKAFDQSVDELDAATLSKLNRGRQAALSELNRPKLFSARPSWMTWMPVGGVAATVLIAVLVLRAPEPTGVIDASATDLEILLSEESIELFEDLEFYSWLDTQELDEGSNGDLG